MSALLEVEALTRHFPVRRGLLGRADGLVRAVDGVSFTIEPGTTLGLVGESGCGKTTTSKLILGLDRPTSGSIRFQGENVPAFDRAALGRYRRAIQAVFQDPYASLDPRMRVGAIVAEPLVINERLDRAARRTREGAVEAAAKSAARAIGSQLGRQIVRGVLGSLLGGTTSRRRR